jgi:hypothetical protein
MEEKTADRIMVFEQMLRRLNRNDSVDYLIDFLEDTRHSRKHFTFEEFNSKTKMVLPPTCLIGIYDRHINRINKLLHVEGYREHNLILTLQEVNLKGTSLFIEKLHQNPYLPIGLIQGKIELEEVVRARELERTFRGMGHYFGLDDIDPIKIQLSELDSNGVSVKDPVVISDSFTPLPHKLGDEFKYRRVA